MGTRLQKRALINKLRPSKWVKNSMSIAPKSHKVLIKLAKPAQHLCVDLLIKIEARLSQALKDNSISPIDFFKNTLFAIDEINTGQVT